MATLDITEYTDMAATQAGAKVPTMQEPAYAQQQVAIAGSSAQSAALVGSVVRVASDAACRIEVGSNPTAAGTSKYFPANHVEYFGVRPGHKIAVIAA